jgi:hypothetical protein
MGSFNDEFLHLSFKLLYNSSSGLHNLSNKLHNGLKAKPTIGISAKAQAASLTPQTNNLRSPTILAIAQTTKSSK